jgi:hypothetical protein
VGNAKISFTPDSEPDAQRLADALRRMGVDVELADEYIPLRHTVGALPPVELPQVMSLLHVHLWGVGKVVVAWMIGKGADELWAEVKRRYIEKRSQLSLHVANESGAIDVVTVDDAGKRIEKRRASVASRPSPKKKKKRRAQRQKSTR